MESDLSPLSGTIQFGEGVREADLVVSSVQDDLSEPEESFTIRLVSALGGGRIDVNNSMATVTGKAIHITPLANGNVIRTNLFSS